MTPDPAVDPLRHLTSPLAGRPRRDAFPVFTWDIICDGAVGAQGASPTQTEAIGRMYEALWDAPPGAVGVVRPARLPCSGLDYVYDPPTVQGVRAPDGVVLRHPGLPGGPPRRRPRGLRRGGAS